LRTGGLALGNKIEQSTPAPHMVESIFLSVSALAPTPKFPSSPRCRVVIISKGIHYGSPRKGMINAILGYRKCAILSCERGAWHLETKLSGVRKRGAGQWRQHVEFVLILPHTTKPLVRALHTTNASCFANGGLGTYNELSLLERSPPFAFSGNE
jgi:hypothetical protein